MRVRVRLRLRLLRVRLLRVRLLRVRLLRVRLLRARRRVRLRLRVGRRSPACRPRAALAGRPRPASRAAGRSGRTR